MKDKRPLQYVKYWPEINQEIKKNLRLRHVMIRNKNSMELEKK
jgi:hypothetical protein